MTWYTSGLLSIVGKRGPTTHLSEDQESRLVNYLLWRSKIGIGVPPKDVPMIVKEVLDDAVSKGYIIPEDKKFKDNKPSSQWIYNLMKRHPQLSRRLPENLGFQRRRVTEEVIRAWFSDFENFLQAEHNLVASEFMSEENGGRIFNCDESGFALQGNAGKMCKVLAEKGAKNVHTINTDTKEQITVLCTVSAAGIYEKPLVIFPGKRVPNYHISDDIADGYNLSHTDKGWISSEVFFEWLANIFFPSVQNKATFPIILFVDGHKSHVNLSVSEFCRDHDIILYCLPAHSSHALQPLDVACFGPIKRKWNDKLSEFRSKNNVPMNKAHFFSVFHAMWDEMKGTDHGVGGFRKSGLVPFNPDNIDFLSVSQNNREYDENQEKRYASKDECLGFATAFVLLEKNLTSNQKTLFEHRYMSNYEFPAIKSPENQLYSFYSECRKLLSSKYSRSTGEAATPAVIEPSKDSKNVGGSDCQPSTSNAQLEEDVIAADICNSSFEQYTATDIGITDYFQEVPSDLLATPESSHSLKIRSNTPDHIQTMQATENISVPLIKPYTQYNVSPFKGMFCMTPSPPQDPNKKRKNVKLPHALTGISYLEHMKRRQAEKEFEISEKEKRKEIRRKKAEEKKKLVAQRQAKKAKVEYSSLSEENDSDGNISYGCSDDDVHIDDSSSSDDEEDDANKCFKCKKSKGSNRWICCSLCEKWFHRCYPCVPQQISSLTAKLVKDIEFYCEFCRAKKCYLKK